MIRDRINHPVGGSVAIQFLHHISSFTLFLLDDLAVFRCKMRVLSGEVFRRQEHGGSQPDHFLLVGLDGAARMKQFVCVDIRHGEFDPPQINHLEQAVVFTKTFCILRLPSRGQQGNLRF